MLNVSIVFGLRVVALHVLVWVMRISRMGSGSFTVGFSRGVGAVVLYVLVWMVKKSRMGSGSFNVGFSSGVGTFSRGGGNKDCIKGLSWGVGDGFLIVEVMWYGLLLMWLSMLMLRVYGNE